LGEEENWPLSVEQLLLAFQAVKASSKHTISFLELLGADLDTALLHLEFQAFDNTAIVTKSRERSYNYESEYLLSCYLFLSPCAQISTLS
jgi:hypothetical protein